jgi:dipeptidyl aminopeptidase/acylaminoacyl peptidase
VEGKVSALQWSSDNSRLAIATTSQAIWVYGASLPGVQPPLELVLWQKLQCDAPVRCLQFSADGRRLLTALEDGRLEEWVCTAPGPRRQYQHGGPVYGVAVTRDGSVTVSASADQSVRVWDNLTGQQKFQLTGHRGPVHAVDLSPDETFAVSSGSDGTLRLWDIVGGRQLKQLITFDQTMYAVAVHPAGTRVAAAGADRRVHVLELPSGAELQTLTGHSDYIHSVTWSPDGKRLLSYGYAGQMKVWDGESGQLIQEQKVGQIGNSARYSPDGRSIVVGNGDGTASVIPAL